MGALFVFMMTCMVGVASLLRPWVGVVVYYFSALLGPQYIWWWNFQDLRFSFLVAACTFIGLGLKAIKGECDLRYLGTKVNLWMLLLWLLTDVSYFTGPFVSSWASSGRSPAELFTQTNNIFIFYFCSCLLVTSPGIVRKLGMVLVISTCYLIYWANDQYLSGNWNQFNWGRLMGPRSVDGGSIYGDENAFAVLFVAGIPFMYYIGKTAPRWIRYSLWGLIPLGWHAVFLTGSRGGFLGVVVVTLLMVFRAKKKFLAVPLLAAFTFFYSWQAGDTMKSRSGEIAGYEGESSAESRITAWTGGARMIVEHPVTGVGLGSFITALPVYADSPPRVAHNTLVQIAAESGVVAGLCYLLVILGFVRTALKISSSCRNNESDAALRGIASINDASLVSFAGLIVCSMFLSLNTYEIFFFLVLLNNSLGVLASEAVPLAQVTRSMPLQRHHQMKGPAAQLHGTGR